MTGFPSFAVVIPMFNEESGAGPCVQAVCGELRKLPNRSNLIVVEDGSSDRTKSILHDLLHTESKLIVVAHPHNRGYGAAVCTGMKKSLELGVDYVVFMDSDLTNDPTDLSRFATEMKSETEVIKASRYAPGGGMRGVPWQRALVSRLGNLVASVLFRVGVRDCTNGFRAVKTAILAQLQLTEAGFALIAEELYQCTLIATKYAEIPVTLTARHTSLRSTSFTYDIVTVSKYLKYALRAFFCISPNSESSKR